MYRVLLAIGLVFVILAAGAFFYSQDQTQLDAYIGIGQALSGDTTGYTRAMGPAPIQFPADHGPHPDFKLEWWYYTGNLTSSAGQEFGYQFTVFRNALAPPGQDDSTSASNWRTNQLYFAHFTVTDVQNKKFYAFERFSRGAAGLAGAQSDPYKVWVEDWRAEQRDETMPPMHVNAADNGIAIDLEMDLAKPIVLQGDGGYSVKGPGFGNASYYYSMTRLKTSGTVLVDGEVHDVEGFSWMDREWSTSLLAEDQEGWDWFSLQLDDGRDLMYFNVRNTLPSVSPFEHGVIVGNAGDKTPLEPGEVQLEVLETWESRHGAVYPSKWRMRIPEKELDLLIEPVMNDQELDVSVRYWEGSVRIEGEAGEKPILGAGYVELTGYDRNAAQFTD